MASWYGRFRLQQVVLRDDLGGAVSARSRPEKARADAKVAGHRCTQLAGRRQGLVRACTRTARPASVQRFPVWSTRVHDAFQGDRRPKASGSHAPCILGRDRYHIGQRRQPVLPRPALYRSQIAQRGKGALVAGERLGLCRIPADLEASTRRRSPAGALCESLSPHGGIAGDTAAAGWFLAGEPGRLPALSHARKQRHGLFHCGLWRGCPQRNARPRSLLAGDSPRLERIGRCRASRWQVGVGAAGRSRARCGRAANHA